MYGLLVVPGLELTYDDHDPLLAAHAVAVGLRRFVSLTDGLDNALADARAAGAALIAAHPFAPNATEASRQTARWGMEGRAPAALVDRYELVNRRDFFPWVAEAALPGVAASKLPPSFTPSLVTGAGAIRLVSRAPLRRITGSARSQTPRFRPGSAKPFGSDFSPPG